MHHRVHVYMNPGISDARGEASVERALRPLAGVTWVDVCAHAKIAQIGGNATDETIRAAIEEAGYEVVGVVVIDTTAR